MSTVGITQTLFPVKEVPAIHHNLDEVADNTGYKFIVREDTGKILSCMTNEYKVVTNQEVLSSASKVLKSHNATLSEVRMFGDGARTKWVWRFPKMKVKIDKDDYVNPEIIIKNSYDGTTVVDVMGGAFRMVCSNGMVIGFLLGRKRNVHNVWNKSLDKLEDIIEETVHKITDTFDDKFPVLVETPIKKRHVSEIIKLVPTTAMEPLTQYLLLHKPKTYWDLLNAATWVATHSLDRNRESTHKMESMIYPKITKWAIAQA